MEARPDDALRASTAPNVPMLSRRGSWTSGKSSKGDTLRQFSMSVSGLFSSRNDDKKETKKAQKEREKEKAHSKSTPKPITVSSPRGRLTLGKSASPRLGSTSRSLSLKDFDVLWLLGAPLMCLSRACWPFSLRPLFRPVIVPSEPCFALPFFFFKFYIILMRYFSISICFGRHCGPECAPSL